MTSPSLGSRTHSSGAPQPEMPLGDPPLLERWLERWNARTRERWGLTVSQLARVFWLVVAGLAISVGFAVYIWEANHRARQAELTNRVEEHVKLLRSSTARSLEALHAIAAFMESSQPPPSRAAFHAFVQGPLERLPEVHAFEWIPVVTGSERAEFEARARADGYAGYQFTELTPEGGTRPAPARGRYYPVYYISPESRNLPALGLDLGSHPKRWRALTVAAKTGLPSATSSIRLAQETEAGEAGFLVFVRVMDRTRSEPVLLGFALGVFRVRDIVEPALASAAKSGMDVVLTDRAEPERVLYRTGSGDGAGAPQWQELDVFGRTWQLAFTPNRAFATRSPWNVFAYPLAGLLLTLVIAGSSVRSMQRTLEIERRVEERTEELSREIESRRQTEAALRVTETKYRSIFENAIVGIFQTTPEGSYLDANPALAAIYGYGSREEFMATVRDVGRQLYADGSDRRRFIEAIERDGAVREFISQVMRKDGSLIWISETAVSVKDPDGNLMYYQGSVQDVTERVLGEQIQRRNFEWLEDRVRERTRALGEANQKLRAEVTIRKQAQEEAANAREAQAAFLASMSHEIRTPLNVILGYSQVLQQQAAGDAPEREALQAILQSGQHLLTLVGDVVELSKIEAGRVDLTLGDFNLGALISSLSFMFRARCEKKGLKLTIEGLGASPWWVRSDEGKLRQVLINLLGNAVKFTNAGEVRLRVVPEEDSCVRFEVIDSGIGIPPEEHSAIFERFTQTTSGKRADGAGLGLAIARRLVEVMGGELALRSSPGWGSNFHFTLRFEAPLAVRASETKAHGPRVRISTATPCRALVVDDLEVNRNMMKQLLTTLGCSVEVADSGSAALAMVGELPFDIVFLDVLMPGMDGIQTAQHLRQVYENRLKLVASSASVLGQQREACLTAGFDEFIPKPFRIEQITDCLASLLKVRFVTDGPEIVLKNAALVPEGLSVPPELVRQLREAAELYQVTLLRALLGKLEARGPREHALAERLRERVALYDMNGILSALDALTPPAPAEVHP